MKVKKKRKEAEREEEVSAIMVSKGALALRPPCLKVFSGAGDSFCEAEGICPC